MADLQLQDYLTFMKSELRLLNVDDSYRSGYTGDTENTSNPNSVSLTSKLNEAIAEIQVKLKFAKSEATVATVSGTQVYTLPAGLQTIESIYISGNRLRQTTVEDKDAIKFNWRGDSGTPTQYYLVGARKFGLYAKPNAILTVSVYGLSTLTELAGNTDTQALMPESYQYIFPIKAVLNIASDDTGSQMNQDRIKYLEGRFSSLAKDLFAYLSGASVDENAAVVVSGRAQTLGADQSAEGTNLRPQMSENA